MKKNRIVRLFMALLIFIPIIFTACSNAEQKKEDKVDANTVSESPEVERVVTAYKPATDFIVALGETDKLVGAQDKAKSDEILNQIMGDDISKLSEVGSKKNGINIEEVISLDPDLVILYPTDEEDEAVRKLKEQNIEVLIINPEKLDSLQDEILRVGEAIGASEKANEILEYYDEKLEYMDKKTEGIDRKNVYIVGSKGVLSTISSDMLQSEIVDRAGGINVASDLAGGTSDVTIEQLLNWNPDSMVSLMYSEGGSSEEINADERIKDLKAVQNGEVYQIPSNINAWDMPQPTSILSIMWVGKTLYPEEFKELDVLKEANEFYKKFYGKSFEELGGKLESE